MLNVIFLVNGEVQQEAGAHCGHATEPGHQDLCWHRNCRHGEIEALIGQIGFILLINFHFSPHLTKVDTIIFMEVDQAMGPVLGQAVAVVDFTPNPYDRY